MYSTLVHATTIALIVRTFVPICCDLKYIIDHYTQKPIKAMSIFYKLNFQDSFLKSQLSIMKIKPNILKIKLELS